MISYVHNRGDNKCLLTNNSHVCALVDGVKEGRVGGHLAAVAAAEAPRHAPQHHLLRA